MIVLAIAFAASVVDDGSIYASTFKTEQLATVCAQSTGRPLEMNACTGYVLAVYDTMSSNRLICPGPGASTSMAIVRMYVAGNPETWDKLASDVVATPLKSPFPCPWTKYQKGKAGS